MKAKFRTGVRTTPSTVHLRTRTCRCTPEEVYWKTERHHLLVERKALQEELYIAKRDNLQLKSDLLKAQEKSEWREQKIVTLRCVLSDLQWNYDAIKALWRESIEQCKRGKEERKRKRDKGIFIVRCILFALKSKILKMERQAELKQIHQRELSERLQKLLSDIEEELIMKVEQLTTFKETLLAQTKETGSMSAGAHTDEVSSACKSVFEVWQEIASMINIAKQEEIERMSTTAKESAKSNSMEESSEIRPFKMGESLSEMDQETLTELSATEAHLECSQQAYADLRAQGTGEDQSHQLEARYETSYLSTPEPSKP